HARAQRAPRAVSPDVQRAQLRAGQSEPLLPLHRVARSQIRPNGDAPNTRSFIPFSRDGGAAVTAPPDPSSQPPISPEPTPRQTVGAQTFPPPITGQVRNIDQAHLLLLLLIVIMAISF